MKITSAFPKRHWIIAALVVLVFGTIDAVASETWAGFYYALIGPFAGGAYRDWQSCCAEFSLSLFYIFGPVLLLGFAFQFLPGLRRGFKILKLLTWATAWVAWCLSGWISFGHAAS